MADIAAAPREFWIDTYHRAAEVMVSVHGDLDLSSAPWFDVALKRLAEADASRDIIVDLTDAQVLDVTGVSLLFRWSRSLRSHGADLVLSAPSASARAALHGSGLYELFTITRA